MAKSISVSGVIDEIISSPELAEGVSKDQFCKVWPQVKEGLNLLATLYPKAKIVVAILIEIGDRVCPSR